MIQNLLVLLALTALLQPVLAADKTDVLLAKAVEALEDGDFASAGPHLTALLKRNPDDLQVHWLRLSMRLSTTANLEFHKRAAPLAAIAPEFARFAQSAQKGQQQSLLHYTSALYASYYNAYERALSEIDKAITLEPHSARFVFGKGRLLAHYGDWTRRDSEIEEGIQLMRKSQQLYAAQPDPYYRPRRYDFALASAIASLRNPRWAEVVGYYQRYIEQAANNTTYSRYAWNNISVAYLRLGQCKEARDAADRAMTVGKFGAALTNRRLAEFCMEMQGMAMMALPDAPERSRSLFVDTPRAD